MRARSLVAASAIAVAISVAGASIGTAAPNGAGSKGDSWSKRVGDATRFLRGRIGNASFAIVDERGRIHGSRRGVRHSSASVVKAMLLVAYLRRGDVRRRRLRAGERRLLGPMIRISDNEAANVIYARVGADGLNRLARRAGMRRFTPNPVWGGSQITARDQARFFFRIDRLIPRRHRKYALGLLRRIVAGQRWGIPRVGPRGWRVHFKGGWTPADDGWRVNQAALLRLGRRRLSIAVLTHGNPSLAYGAGTIAGVAARLLRGYRSGA